MPVLIQLLIPLAVVGLLAFSLRWVLGRGRDQSARAHDDRANGRADRAARDRAARDRGYDRARDRALLERAAALTAAIEPPTVDDYGLLAPVGSFDGRGEAERVRGLLNLAGIRATIAVRSDGRTQVLVFRNELLKARRVGGGHGGTATGGATT